MVCIPALGGRTRIEFEENYKNLSSVKANIIKEILIDQSVNIDYTIIAIYNMI